MTTLENHKRQRRGGVLHFLTDFMTVNLVPSGRVDNGS